MQFWTTLIDQITRAPSSLLQITEVLRAASLDRSLLTFCETLLSCLSLFARCPKLWVPLSKSSLKTFLCLRGSYLISW